MLLNKFKNLICITLITLFFVACGGQPMQSSFAALKMFPEPKSFSGFQLTNHLGKKWQANDFKGNYSILFFGFANCPDICPTTLLDLQKVEKALEKNQVKMPEVVFISVDPDRDTPELLNQYISYFSPNFTALTGDAANILSITTQIGVAYNIEEHDKGDLIYDVDHASALYVLNPEGQRIGIFQAPHDIDTLINDIKKLMENS